MAALRRSQPGAIHLAEPADLGAARTGHHVLLVDDNPSTLMLYGRILQSNGYRVTVAENGAAALDALDKEVPDLIVLDYEMPWMSGAELLAEIRSSASLSSVPVIFLTGSGDSEERVSGAFDAGVNDYISKPVRQLVLLARVKALIVQHKRYAANDEVQKLVRHNDELRAEVVEAGELQRAQLPSVPVAWQGWIADAAVEPCASVGGDLFDVIVGPDSTRVIALIDVSGHGVAAAMVASAVRAMLRILVSTTPFADIPSELNCQLLQDPNNSYYACVALVQIGPTKIHVINAGLPPVAILAEGRVIAQVVGSGPPIGLLDEAEYEMQTFDVRPEMRIALASDGLTEPFGLAHEILPYLSGLGLLAPRSSRPAPNTNDDRSLKVRLSGLFAAGQVQQADDATIIVVDSVAS
jgi:CheY-like chemotaxis protein